MARESDPATRQLSAEQLEQLLSPATDEVKTTVFRATGAEPATVVQCGIRGRLERASLPPAAPSRPAHARSVEPATVLEVQVPDGAQRGSGAGTWLGRLTPRSRALGLGGLVVALAAGTFAVRSSRSTTARPAAAAGLATAVPGEADAGQAAAPREPSVRAPQPPPAHTSRPTAEDSAPRTREIPPGARRAAVDALVAGRDAEARDRYRALSAAAPDDVALAAVSKVLDAEAARCREDDTCD